MQSKIDALSRVTHELLTLGLDGSPIYADDFSRLNQEVYQLAEKVYQLHSTDPNEEAVLCLALLTGYAATIYNYGDKEKKIETLLNRSFEVLDKIPASVIKCKLLMYCYIEIGEKKLLHKAREIIISWEGRKLTKEEKEVMEEYNCLIKL